MWMKPLWKTDWWTMLQVRLTVLKYSLPHVIKSSWKYIKGKVK